MILHHNSRDNGAILLKDSVQHLLSKILSKILNKDISVVLVEAISMGPVLPWYKLANITIKRERESVLKCCSISTSV